MPSYFSVEKSKKSSVKRLSLLPRLGIVIEIGGKKFGSLKEFVG